MPFLSSQPNDPPALPKCPTKMSGYENNLPSIWHTDFVTIKTAYTALVGPSNHKEHVSLTVNTTIPVAS